MRSRVKIQIEKDCCSGPKINELIKTINGFTNQVHKHQGICVRKVKEDPWTVRKYTLVIYGYNIPHFKELFLVFFVNNISAWKIIKY